ncbi:MAG: S-adenosylmethionine--diacylglycerol 3-amino-3-carboxypropyl transferase [Rhizobiaceae bacterium MnEN-MB40S]|nr:MAG: S-adenosylmethionine--diacylglycerol 3-amino-3-carboxypropyl transferase [Rhizobiaceae bacterium MnEN-MB40S]
MSDIATESGFVLSGKRHLGKALYQNRAYTKEGLSERLFALLFTGLVYPQIWEDPKVDMEAMALCEGHRIVTIASGGCNVLAYLTARPESIDVVDLNKAHIALNRMKLTAMRRLPGHSEVLSFFARDNQRGNSAIYDQHIAPHLDPASRSYWERRTIKGRRRIEAFNGNFYKGGLLGWFIATGHLIARLHGVDPAEIMQSGSLREQRRFFDDRLAPLFEKPLVKWMTGRKASLFGLGIPPAQYDELLAGEETMAEVLKARLEKLACHFPLKENYFAWQAFARRYPEHGAAELPAYLQEDHYETIRDLADNVSVNHIGFTDFLRHKPAASLDRYVLLDAQDWMSDAQLNELWSEITRTADTGARVIFRTAGAPTILPGRVDAAILDQWNYRETESETCCRRDRSAIYGGFHLYEKRAS